MVIKQKENGMKIAEKVRQYREEHNMSQREFAKLCGLSSVVISFLERGERSNGDPYIPRFETVRKIARGMGTTPEQLISECEDFDFDISVGIEETPLYEDWMKELQSQTPDESMLIQAYRMIPPEHLIEAMQCIFRIKDKYEGK
jgi:transcriptional regulator with XRE-family HTH domain